MCICLWIIFNTAIFNHGYMYWLASPNANLTTRVSCVNSNSSNISFADIDFYYGGIRPVICLKSNVELKLSEDGSSYSIK